MTAAIIVILVLIAIGAAAALVVRRRNAGASRPGPSAPASPAGSTPSPGATTETAESPIDGLGIGAVVAHEGVDYIVRGALRFDEDGYIWSEYHLDAGGDQRTWLAVDLTDGTDVALWQSVESPTALAPGSEVTHGGVTYKKVESGRARFDSTGTTGLPTVGQCWYVDYQEVAGDRRLGFERWTEVGAWEVSVGQVVPAHLLDVTPADRVADAGPGRER